VIIHAGVIDCTPRCMKLWESELLNINNSVSHFSRKYIKKFISRHHAFISSRRNITHTSESAFQKQFRCIVNLVKDFSQYLLVVGILPPGKYLKKQCPGFMKKREIYNQILFKELSRIENSFFYLMDEIEQDIDEYLLEDGVHFNARGHDYLYNTLKPDIDSIVCKGFKRRYSLGGAQ
jgi:lysophospholipase L1-like esterase